MDHILITRKSPGIEKTGISRISVFLSVLMPEVKIIDEITFDLPSLAAALGFLLWCSQIVYG